MHYSRTPAKIANSVPFGVIAFTGLPAFGVAVVRPVSAVFDEPHGNAN